MRHLVFLGLFRFFATCVFFVAMMISIPSCREIDEPWTAPYESYKSGVRVNGVDYHIVRTRNSYELGGDSFYDKLRIVMHCVMRSRNYRRDTNLISISAIAYIDTVVVSGVRFNFDDLLNSSKSVYDIKDSLNAALCAPDVYGRLEANSVLSSISFCGKSFRVENGWISFWVRRSLGGDPEFHHRIWGFKRCEFECVAKSNDGEEIVLTEGYLCE